LRLLAVLAVGIFVGSLMTAVVSAQGDNTYTGCLDAKGKLEAVAIGQEPVVPCRSSQTQVSWNEAGPVGPAGPTGTGGATVARVDIPGGIGCYTSLEFNTVGKGCPGDTTFPGQGLFSEVRFDPADYPPAATLSFWVQGSSGSIYPDMRGTICFRLFDVTAEVAVPNTESCISSLVFTYFRAQVGTVGLDDFVAGHYYALQDKHEGLVNPDGGPTVSGYVYSAWLEIDWE
jgi:hypothetical protein